MSSFRRTLLLKAAQSRLVQRYVYGTSIAYNQVGMSLDGGNSYLTTTADSSGNWRINIPANTVIITLAHAFSAEKFAANYNITSISLDHIGDVSSCTSTANMFYNCSAMRTVNLQNTLFTTVSNMTTMFGGCLALTSCDLRTFNTSNIPLTGDTTGMSNLFYMATTGVLSEVYLPEMRVYVSSNFFNGCANLSRVRSCGTIHQRFKIYHCPLDRESALVLFNALSTTPPATPNINLHSNTYGLLSAADIQIATNKGWYVVNGNT